MTSFSRNSTFSISIGSVQLSRAAATIRQVDSRASTTSRAERGSSRWNSQWPSPSMKGVVSRPGSPATPHSHSTRPAATCTGWIGMTPGKSHPANVPRTPCIPRELTRGPFSLDEARAAGLTYPEEARVDAAGRLDCLANSLPSGPYLTNRWLGRMPAATIEAPIGFVFAGGANGRDGRNLAGQGPGHDARRSRGFPQARGQHVSGLPRAGWKPIRHGLLA